jgi:hypothetical protein
MDDISFHRQLRLAAQLRELNNLEAEFKSNTDNTVSFLNSSLSKSNSSFSDQSDKEEEECTPSSPQQVEISDNSTYPSFFMESLVEERQEEVPDILSQESQNEAFYDKSPDVTQSANMSFSSQGNVF